MGYIQNHGPYKKKHINNNMKYNITLSGVVL